eukprot:362766_1
MGSNNRDGNVAELQFDPLCFANIKRHDSQRLHDIILLLDDLKNHVVENAPCRPPPGTLLVYRKGNVEYKADSYSMSSCGSGTMKFGVKYKYYGISVNGQPQKKFQRQVATR